MKKVNWIYLIVVSIVWSIYLFWCYNKFIRTVTTPDSKLYYEVVTKTTFCKENSKNGVVLTVIKTDTLGIDTTAIIWKDSCIIKGY
jgi:hypothetical protein